jgi:cytochrome c oxidase subunit 3
MADQAIAEPGAELRGLESFIADWSGDQEAFKRVHWGKAMMWIFLLSDTFVFGCFLTSYMTVRSSTTMPWPNASEVFALTIGGQEIPLILIAIMTFIRRSMGDGPAVNSAIADRTKAMLLMLATAAFGATFVGMQAFEWIFDPGRRSPWAIPGAPQFGSATRDLASGLRVDRRDLSIRLLSR